MDDRKSDARAEQGAADSFAVKPPALSLPKGGGAIRGIGEKFAANPVTGTGSMSVPIATSPGRGGFGPQLSLTYDSGSGNGPFGFGWSLTLPAITRKTDKGLPQYRDAEASDVFMLSGAEDLVPVLVQTGGQWQRQTPQSCRVGNDDYLVDSYRPRIEGLFARIERWKHSSGKVHWRSISQDNILTLYGKDDNARICDPEDPNRIYSWLISESRDDKGNAVLYDYKAEDGEGVDLARAHERNRGGRSDVRRTAQRYLKRIRYGNRHTLLDDAGARPPQLSAAQIAQTEWMFEVVFDYGEHDALAPRPQDAGPWVCRPDAFSSYRAGFELRSARLCQRVLMFHHFEGEPGVGRDCLVRSTDFTYLSRQDRIYIFLQQVTQSGYQRRAGPGGGYEKRSLPPLEFEYTHPVVQGAVEEVDPSALDNLPVGVDGGVYQWTDLHGEGIPGILTEQAGAWYYKRNLSPLAGQAVEFASMESVRARPYLSLGEAQFMDLAGKGRPDLVVLDGPMPGFFSHDTAEGWETFRPFVSRLNRDMRDPNLRFIDLDGDGHADVLISEDDALVWHASLAQEGFGPARRVVQPLDEEQAPRLVFADGTQSIYLSDMSGDGLTDLVRIRNGEVCYWPNLGYGRFGAKVSMDRAPYFDHPDQFDQRRIRMADIDGSGSTDLVYLHRDGVRLYFNESGNSWSAAQALNVFPPVDDLASVMLADLLGNGTACLVWSSALPGEARRQMRYVNLMGEHKPHLLVKTRNNLGAETEVAYAPSTRFYLQDRLAGQPWITKLPFPVHVVVRSTVKDLWRNTRFSSTYSYHHGCFDEVEREFRGFARVEQVDVEHYGKFAQGNAASPYITDQQNLYQPPVKTVTWYHTGVTVERERILSALKQEYFAVPGFAEHPLPEPALFPADLAPEEWREAVRACKGMVLRQETFELDVDALAQGREVPVRLYSTAYHNSDIRRLQPRVPNRHAVFLVTESEAITYHYELDLRQQQPAPDPRITHTLNLSLDAYGRVLQSVAAVYPRRFSSADLGHLLTTEQVELIRAVQGERHLAYTETHFCAELATDPHRHRLPAPCEALSYELTGDDVASGFHPGAGGYFTRADFQAYALSETLSGQGSRSVTTLAYQQHAASGRAHRRLIEWVRMLYFKEDLSGPEDFGTYAWPGLPYETYKLALTTDLLDRVFGTKLTSDVLARLNTASLSGYTPGTALSAGFNGQWWIRSGIAGFASDAARHFYLSEEYTDPFGNKTTLAYDTRDLYVRASTDALGNSSSVAKFDYRVLAPCEMIDANANHSEVIFDVLGLPVATAIKGKEQGNGVWEGDDLSGFDFALCNPSAQAVEAFCASPVMDETTARAWLGRATTRFVYHFGGIQGQWRQRMSGACSIVREQHQSTSSPLQISLECSDGSGTVLMEKLQAEPDPVTGATRWIVNGLTVLNNKGKPVKQYEPAFSPDFGCELPQAHGVTSITYYDAAGRVLRVEMPDGTFSRAEFTPWFSRSFDANDTVLESTWYRERGRDRFDPAQPLPVNPVTGQLTANPDERAGWLAAQHAHTPAETHFDSLGREVIVIAHNRTQGADEKYLTYTRLDAEGKPLWVRDARGHLVMQYITPAKENHDPNNALPLTAVPCYDIAGNLLYQHSMDAGDRWTMMDAAGKPMLAWDVNDRGPGTVPEQRMYRTDYDALHRPMAQWIVVDGGAPAQTEAFVYCDTGQIQGAADLDDARRRNLVGQAVRHYDATGLATVERMDLCGKPAHVTRTLIRPDAGWTSGWVDWSTDRTAALESDIFHQRTAYDALGRMIRLYHWHRGTGSRVAVYLPDYGERGLLRSESLVVGAVKRDDGYEGGTSLQAIVAQRHDAKGQCEYLELGNGVRTVYEHDPQTLRLRRLRSTRGASETCGNGRASLWLDNRVLQDLHYSYDPMGNLTEIRDEAIATTYAANERVDAISRYVYDALYRLINASGREHAAAASQEQTPQIEALPCVADHTFRNYTQSYGYDAVGNILRMQHHARAGSWTRHYEYAFDDPDYQPASNRLWRTWQGSNAWDAGNATQKVVYQHDAHGSLLNLGSVPQDFHLHWDHRDMISSIHLGNGWAYYQYGADKQRSRKWIDRSVQQSSGNTQDISEERIDLGGLEIYRQRVNGILKQEIETLHLFDGEQRLLMVDQVHDLATGDAILPRYTLSNHLGSSTLELDEQAQLISCEDYHPYGTSAYRAGRSEAEVKRKRYRYTGMERDEESGLSYHSSRHYLPQLARWCSSDPLLINAGINVYLYASANPICRIDRNGMADESGMASRGVRVNLLGDPNSESQKVWRVGSHKTIGYDGNGFEVPLQPTRGPGLWSEHGIARSWMKASLQAIGGSDFTGKYLDYFYNRMTTLLTPSGGLKNAKNTLDNRYGRQMDALLAKGEPIPVGEFPEKALEHYRLSAAEAKVELTPRILNRQVRQVSMQFEQLTAAWRAAFIHQTFSPEKFSFERVVSDAFKSWMNDLLGNLKTGNVKTSESTSPRNSQGASKSSTASKSSAAENVGMGLGVAVWLHLVLPDSVKKYTTEPFFEAAGFAGTWLLNLYANLDYSISTWASGGIGASFNESKQQYIDRQMSSSGDPSKDDLQVMKSIGFSYDGLDSKGQRAWSDNRIRRVR